MPNGQSSGQMSSSMQNEMEAMALWESHLAQAADKWKRGVEESEDDYRSGLASFLGVDPSEISDETTYKWEESVEQMSPQEFANKVRREGADWLINLYEGVTGEQAPKEVRNRAHEIEDEVVSETDLRQQGGGSIAEKMRQAIQKHAEEHHGGRR